MKPKEIRSELVLNEITGADIAREAGCTKQYVSSIIKRIRTNAKVEQIIANAIGRPVEEVFPPQTKEAA